MAGKTSCGQQSRNAICHGSVSVCAGFKILPGMPTCGEPGQLDSTGIPTLLFGSPCPIVLEAATQVQRTLPVATLRVAESATAAASHSSHDDLPMTSKTTADRSGDSRRVVFACLMGSDLSHKIAYGTMRATIEMAGYLKRHGWEVIVVGCSRRPIASLNGIPCVTESDEKSLESAVRKLGPVDTLVGISRSDVFAAPNAGRCLVYHHGPHRVLGLPVTLLNRLRIPVICVSEHSRRQQLYYGVHEDLLHVVPNGYDSCTFSPDNRLERSPHSLLFAGHIVPYKGFDIALLAFLILRRRFPDATLLALGEPCSWQRIRHHVLPSDWLHEDGRPHWDQIARACPGFRYGGEVAAEDVADAMRRSSILVMPSRIPETFGIASVEAQACGCIPVLPKQGAFGETLQNEITGYLYEPNTPESLAEFIASLWSQHRPAPSQRARASEWVSEKFSWRKSGQAMSSLLLELPVRGHYSQRLIECGRLCYRATSAFHRLRSTSSDWLRSRWSRR